MIDNRTLIIIAIIGGAGALALVRTNTPAPAPFTPAAPAAPPIADPTGELPPGHPPLSETAQTAQQPVEKPAASITWAAPKRWELVQHPSAMRIATYRVPKLPGDPEDAELSITRAGGEVEANASRWVGQFGGKNSKRTIKTIGAFKVHLVEAEGAYTTMKGDLQQDWALLGAIVETPGMSHFFKLTGPKKSVAAAHAEFDSFLASLK